MGTTRASHEAEGEWGAVGKSGYCGVYGKEQARQGDRSGTAFAGLNNFSGLWGKGPRTRLLGMIRADG